MSRRLILSLALALAGCGDPLDPQWDRLEDAEARWEANGPSSYSYTIEYSCLCSQGGLTYVVVDADTVAQVWMDPEDYPHEPAAYTVEELFEIIREELDDEPDEARLEFDEIGYPVRVRFDFDDDSFDDEYSISIEQFVDLTASPSSVTANPSRRARA